MIPGLKIDSATEKKILDMFKDEDVTLYQKLQEKGLHPLMDDYEALVKSLETKTCMHGPNGSALSGIEYEDCCGNEQKYSEDYQCRTVIQQIIDLLPLGEAHRVSAILAPIDERYKKQLIKSDSPVLDEFRKQYPEERYWWLYLWPISILQSEEGE